MNTQYMEYFITTADIGSVTLAANEIFISPQGLNKALRKIETEYGLHLFYFENGKFLLTEAGSMVYRSFTEMLAVNKRLKETIGVAKRNGAQNEYWINVVASPIFVDLVIPGILNDLRHRRLKVNLRIFEYSSHMKFEVGSLSDETIFLIGAAGAKFDSICRKAGLTGSRKILFRTDLRACVSKQSELSQKEVITVEDMMERKLVLCRHEDYFLKVMGLDYPLSSIARHLENKAGCLSEIGANPNYIGFTNELETAYYSDRQTVAVPLAIKIPLNYGYLTNQAFNEGEHLFQLLPLVEARFQKLDGYSQNTPEAESSVTRS